jgi:hypothetical protein
MTGARSFFFGFRDTLMAVNDWNIELPDDLVPFERLDGNRRSFLTDRLNEQFTTEAAAQLYDLGREEEKNGPLVAAPVEEHRPSPLKVELVPSAHADWQCFSRRLAPSLEAAVHVLRSDAGYGSSVVPLMRDQGFLLRHGHLRVVYRRAPHEKRVVLHAIGCWAVNPLAKVWRYFSQMKAEDLLTTSDLYLRRLDLLTSEFEGDPYEGTPTFHMLYMYRRAHAETLGPIDEGEAMKRYEHERRATFVSCWQKSEHESWWMWKQYCADNGGFALQTTERKLHHLLTVLREKRDTLYLRSVHYADHWDDDPLPHDVPEQAFLKPVWFSDEKEIRFVWFRGEHAYAGTEEQIEAALSKLDKGERIKLSLASVVDRVVLHPFCKKDQREKILAILEDKQRDLAPRVADSAIRKKPVGRT